MRAFGSVQLLFVVFGVLLVTCDSFAPYEGWALITFKEAIYEDPNMAFSNWNALDADPCDWSGISCSAARDHVLKINISNSGLKGFLTPDLGHLTYLQELIFHDNNLIGTIPKEVGMLKNLEVLDLGMNQLSGPIPPEIGNLTNAIRINLESNGLTGTMPQELGNLKYLEELLLDRNKLQGNVPAESSINFTSNVQGMYTSNANSSGLCRLSQLKVADFSFNFLVGGIPKCLEYLPSVSFQGNCLQNKDPKQRSSAQCGASPPGKSHSDVIPKHRSANDEAKHQNIETYLRCNSKPSIIIPWKKSASEKDQISVYIDSDALKDIMRFSRQELEVACEDFSNIIGSSPDSLVYKGTIKGGPEIAVISLCIKEEHWTGYLELYFQREVADLARLNHDNTGRLLGYCKESTPFTRMLVFEYASNGTLYEHLHYGEGCQLSWTRRMKIVLGIARGLKYLHELDPPFTISELNSSAVYLTEDFYPKLVDFESWKTILARSEKHSGSIDSQGSICVLPNSLEGRHEDVQGNIHAFGVLLLEIVSGRPPFCKDKGSLVNWAKDYLELPEVMSCVVDPELKHFQHEDLKVVCEVVSLCLNADPIKRPSMQEISSMLETQIDTSFSSELKSSSLAWAELALSS
ncbi:hypothetical protein NL676_011267 [Syzygium grande]|nr:hypothetical protein NL676_011267 [Syzygium grande]